VSLSAYFTRQFKRLNDCLFLLVESFSDVGFLDLHRQELAHNFDDLVVRGLKAKCLICALVDFSLQLNNHHHLVFLEIYRLSYLRYRLYRVLNIIESLVGSLSYGFGL
jgi:hypothetical protein